MDSNDNSYSMETDKIASCISELTAISNNIKKQLGIIEDQINSLPSCWEGVKADNFIGLSQKLIGGFKQYVRQLEEAPNYLNAARAKYIENDNIVNRGGE